MLRKGRRKVKSWIWITVLVCLLIVCMVSGYFLLSGNQEAQAAQIISDGKILRTVDLQTDQEFTVPSSNGGYNIITVQDGKIGVSEASCPDHYCMHRGFLSGGTDIVCLPNKLVIRFLGQQDVDSAVG